MLRSISFRSLTGSTPPDKEMHEIIRPNSTDESMETIQPPDLTAVNDRSIQRSECPLIYKLCSPSTPRPCRTMHRTLSHLKDKFIPHRAKRMINCEKNHDYVVVDKPGVDHICSAQELIQSPEFFCAEPMQVQFSINPSMDQQPCDIAALIDMQSTRSGVQCDGQLAELMEIHNDVHGAASSTSSSSASSTSTSSTISSNYEFAGIDRSIFDDTEYIRAQQFDLERVTSLEIYRSRELRNLRQTYGLTDEEEAEWMRSYNEAKSKNTQLKEELRRLTDEHDRVNLPWTCTSCTFINEPYSVTHLNACQMCECPSPSIQMMLMQ